MKCVPGAGAWHLGIHCGHHLVRGGRELVDVLLLASAGRWCEAASHCVACSRWMAASSAAGRLPAVLARCLPLQTRWVFWLALAASLSAVLDGFDDAHPRGGVPRPRVSAACAFSWLNWWVLFSVCTCASKMAAFAGWRSRAWAPLALSCEQPAVPSGTVSCGPACNCPTWQGPFHRGCRAGWDRPFWLPRRDRDTAQPSHSAHGRRPGGACIHHRHGIPAGRHGGAGSCG